MKIAVNTRLLLSGKLDGIGWFTHHVLRHLATDHPDVEFIFFFDRPWDEEFIFNENVTPVKLFPQARHPFLYYLWFEHAVPRALHKHNIDLFLSPDGYLSLSTDVPQVGVIHDLNFEHHPKDLPFLTRWYYRYYFPQFALKAKRIATVSEFSKKDIVHCYGVEENKIDVVYNGVNEIYQPINEQEKTHTREKVAHGKPYFLFVGMLHPRKNITRLFKSFEQFKKTDIKDFKLVIVGKKMWWTHEMESTYVSMKFKNDVIFTGTQPVDELKNIVASAHAMTYVSCFEGFGVPIIESMRCGVPVITSNITSMPEISGDAALLVDPFNTNSISEAMTKIALDDQLWKRLAAAGMERSKLFSWKKTSGLMWETIIKST
jgi:glycosyltransferase involved in cell wall biosynthesis